MTDDEAYYWALAQRPGWGFAYHPPLVVWMIAVSQFIVGSWVGMNSPIVVRLPSALCASGILYFAMLWLRDAGIKQCSLPRASLVLLSFAGFFGLSWMMVPDLPLFLGWMILFLGTWRSCFKIESSSNTALFIGSAIALLSKFSAVLALGPALISLVIWAPRSQIRKKIFVLLAGAFIASIPILIWNVRHEWSSILFQLRDRHGDGHVSWIRYGRFWAVEMLVVGPMAGFFGLRYLIHGWRRLTDSHYTFVWIWAIVPAGVFFIQPLWSDFKPHWAFAAWLPLFLALAKESSDNTFRMKTALKAQVTYGLVLNGLILISCHLPIGGFLGLADPRADVSNDLYGWRDLPKNLAKSLDSRDLALPMIGSRYQTASQAAFALGSISQVTKLPLDTKEFDEWPELQVTDGQGPHWPRLLKPVLFVGDNRYDAPPAFAHANCQKIARLNTKRLSFDAKWIDVWKCNPS